MDDDLGLYVGAYPDDYGADPDDFDDFEDGDDRDWRDDDSWYDDDPWRDDDVEPRCPCFGCYDTGYVSTTGRRCRSCNPPTWLTSWWTVTDKLTAPTRWLRRRLRRKPDHDEWGPF